MFKQQMLNNNIDVFCISETWLRESLTSNILDIPVYRIYRLDRHWSENNNINDIKKGGGLCMYIKQNIEFTNSDICELNCSSKDIEIQWMTLRFPKMRDLIIANVYRPPQGNVKNCCKYIRSCLDDLDNMKKKDIFNLGDFNINMCKKSSTESKNLLRLMSSYGFKQYINEITRFGMNNACLDLIFSNWDYINNSGTHCIHNQKEKTHSKKKMTFFGRS